MQIIFLFFLSAGTCQEQWFVLQNEKEYQTFVSRADGEGGKGCEQDRHKYERKNEVSGCVCTSVSGTADRTKQSAGLCIPT